MENSSGKKLRVLLAEDNLINQELATIILQKNGCEVVHAHNGKEAVEKFGDGKYDFILMDIQMPGMDGLEATRRIREMEKGEKTPIIAMTAYAVEGDKERCIAIGMDDYISKPIKAKNLQDIVERFTVSKSKEEKKEETEHLYKGDAPVDMIELMDSLANDEMLLNKLIEVTMRSYKTKIERIENALLKSDFKEIEVSAHSFKGSIGILSKKVHGLAFSIEVKGKNNDIEEIEGILKELKEEMIKIESFFEKREK